MALGLYDTDLAPARLRAELAAVRDLGANNVSLPVYWFQQDVAATEIQPYAGPGFSQERYDEQVRAVVHGAHDLAGAFLWNWPLGQAADPAGYSWRGKPAEAEIGAWYRRS